MNDEVADKGAVGRAVVDDGAVGRAVVDDGAVGRASDRSHTHVCITHICMYRNGCRNSERKGEKLEYWRRCQVEGSLGELVLLHRHTQTHTYTHTQYIHIHM